MHKSFRKRLKRLKNTRGILRLSRDAAKIRLELNKKRMKLRKHLHKRNTGRHLHKRIRMIIKLKKVVRKNKAILSYLGKKRKNIIRSAQIVPNIRNVSPLTGKNTKQMFKDIIKQNNETKRLLLSGTLKKERDVENRIGNMEEKINNISKKLTMSEKNLISKIEEIKKLKEKQRKTENIIKARAPIVSPVTKLEIESPQEKENLIKAEIVPNEIIEEKTNILPAVAGAVALIFILKG